MISTEKKKRISIVKIFQDNPTLSCKRIAKLTEVTEKTGSKVIRNFNSTLSVDRKKGSGRISDKKIEHKVIDVFTKYPSISKRDAAKKSKTSLSMVFYSSGFCFFFFFLKYQSLIFLC